MDLSPPPRKPRAESIVPMINVVFLLLIFFLMTSELSPPEPIEVTPPNAKGEDAEAAQAVLFLGPEGDLAFRELTGPAALAAFAAEAGAAGTQQAPRLRADAKAPATQVAAVLRDLAAAGLSSVALVAVPR
nr:biopolymer transporter ExbD [Pseudooceanicola aestuarii]